MSISPDVIREAARTPLGSSPLFALVISGIALAFFRHHRHETVLQRAEKEAARRARMRWQRREV